MNTRKRQLPDTITAVAETDATGEVADVFADIRATMDLPLITSVWRILAHIQEGLKPAWAAAKTLYETGRPQASLVRLCDPQVLPIPTAIGQDALSEAGVSPHDVSAIRNLLRAYNRSNALNLLALKALVIEPSTDVPDDSMLHSPAPARWLPIPPLLDRSEMNESTWRLLHELAKLGTTAANPSLPTVWRHLAHWPAFLELVFRHMRPLAQDGTIDRSMTQILETAGDEAAGIAHFRPSVDAVSGEALDFIKVYVGEVHSILAICSGIERWLSQVDPTRNDDEFDE